RGAAPAHPEAGLRGASGRAPVDAHPDAEGRPVAARGARGRARPSLPPCGPRAPAGAGAGPPAAGAAPAGDRARDLGRGVAVLGRAGDGAGAPPGARAPAGRGARPEGAVGAVRSARAGRQGEPRPVRRAPPATRGDRRRPRRSALEHHAPRPRGAPDRAVVAAHDPEPPVRPRPRRRLRRRHGRRARERRHFDQDAGGRRALPGAPDARRDPRLPPHRRRRADGGGPPEREGQQRRRAAAESLARGGGLPDAPHEHPLLRPEAAAAGDARDEQPGGRGQDRDGREPGALARPARRPRPPDRRRPPKAALPSCARAPRGAGAHRVPARRARPAAGHAAAGAPRADGAAPGAGGGHAARLRAERTPGGADGGAAVVGGDAGAARADDGGLRHRPRRLAADLPGGRCEPARDARRRRRAGRARRADAAPRDAGGDRPPPLHAGEGPGRRPERREPRRRRVLLPLLVLLPGRGGSVTHDRAPRGAAGVDPSLVIGGAVVAGGAAVAGYGVDPRLGLAVLALPIVVLVVASPAIGAALLLFALPLEELAVVSPGGAITLHKLLGIVVIGAWLVG